MIKSIYTKESDILRKWLLEKRRAMNLTQRQLAELLSIHHSIIGKIETGERQVNVVELVYYCKILKADPLEIINKLKNT